MTTKADETGAGERPAVQAERAGFKTLLAANPNYFGTAKESGFPAQVEIIGNTSYEQIDCVSYNPELRLLEATISIKLPYGYGGDLCQAGSLEFVRFFLDYGSGWTDAGLASVSVHDLPEQLDCFEAPVFPLRYTATVQVTPEGLPCWLPVLPVARAILSWSVIPTGPEFTPVWGGVAECAVQIKPRPPLIADVLAEIGTELKHPVKLPSSFRYAESILLPGPPPEPIDLASLARLYAAGEQEPAGGRAAEGTAVPAHRFGFAEIAQAVGAASLSSESVAKKIADWDAAGLSWVNAVTAVNEIGSDVTFEELECVGLDNNISRLVASFKIKRPTGYNGGLCQAGSTEYVAFWASGWDDSCGWSYLGTAGVVVHGNACGAEVAPATAVVPAGSPEGHVFRAAGLAEAAVIAGRPLDLEAGHQPAYVVVKPDAFQLLEGHVGPDLVDGGDRVHPAEPGRVPVRDLLGHRFAAQARRADRLRDLGEPEPVRGHGGALCCPAACRFLLHGGIQPGQRGEIDRLRGRPWQQDRLRVAERGRELDRVLELGADLGEHVGDERRPWLDLHGAFSHPAPHRGEFRPRRDRKSTRLNSSHPSISYAV